MWGGIPANSPVQEEGVVLPTMNSSNLQFRIKLMGSTRRYRMKIKRQWEMGLHRMKKKISAGIDTTVIPKGYYCYTYDNGKFACCPFWEAHREYGEQNYGYCSLMELGDWMVGMGLLWDQVKECGINKEDTDESVGAEEADR